MPQRSFRHGGLAGVRVLPEGPNQGIDPVLWRVGFVGLTSPVAPAALIYLFLWVLTPSDPLPDDTWPSPVEQLVQRIHRAVPGALASMRRD